jgi:hypothetical protein
MDDEDTPRLAGIETEETVEEEQADWAAFARSECLLNAPESCSKIERQSVEGQEERRRCRRGAIYS